MAEAIPAAVDEELAPPKAWIDVLTCSSWKTWLVMQYFILYYLLYRPCVDFTCWLLIVSVTGFLVIVPTVLKLPYNCGLPRRIVAIFPFLPAQMWPQARVDGLQ